MLKLQVTLRWQHNDQEQGRGGKWDWGWRLAGDRTWAIWRKAAFQGWVQTRVAECEQGLAGGLGKARG